MLFDTLSHGEKIHGVALGIFLIHNIVAADPLHDSYPSMKFSEMPSLNTLFNILISTRLFSTTLPNFNILKTFVI